MIEKQRTLKNSVKLKGVGLHTGKEVELEIEPANENFGYKFQRTDLEDQPIIEADIDLVVSTERGTTLEKKGTRIYTTEHLLAALVGLEIDNVLIEINAEEPPIMDGSSKFFVDALEKAGLKQLNSLRKEYVIKNVITHKDEKSGSEITVIPSENYQITAMVDYDTKVLGCLLYTSPSPRD